jgi:hypothetical protein
MSGEQDHTDQARSPVGGGRGSPLPAQPGALHIRRPHCHRPVTAVAGTPLVDIACPSCGSLFSLTSLQPTQPRIAAGSKTIGKFTLVQQVGVGQVGSVGKAHDSAVLSSKPKANEIPNRGSSAQRVAVFTTDSFRPKDRQ